MTTLVWQSSFVAYTGYSGSSRAFVLGLDRQGLAVRPHFLYGADHDEQPADRMPARLRELQQLPLRLDVPQVVYAPGDQLGKNSGRYRIGFTMLEVDRLPPAWVEVCNQLDEVWTPSQWGAEVFQASGIKRPIYVVPLGVDLARFKPGPPRKHLSARTVFLSVFEWGPRKGWEVLLRAYRAAFRPDDNVLLVLKIDSRVPATNPAQEFAPLLPTPSPPVALIYNQPLQVEQLVELYQGADCFVLPTRGEGWCMPALEAMACGVPAIVTAWSGSQAFLNEQVGYPLPISGLIETNQPHPYYRNARWAAPDEEALVELLRRVHTHRAEARSKGQAAAIAAQAWSWENAVQVIMARLKQL
jgi:glycosyltransferase involved in cell wall biosynthesis